MSAEQDEMLRPFVAELEDMALELAGQLAS
jgi:hypothetical protein